MPDLDFFRMDSLLQALQQAGMRQWAEQLPRQVEEEIRNRQHGDIPRWRAAVDELPEIEAALVELQASSVTAAGNALHPQQIEALKQTLLRLSPWRKGPYHLHGVQIDTEWRSDWKWNRILPHIRPLGDRCVLDIGCGNGKTAQADCYQAQGLIRRSGCQHGADSDPAGTVERAWRGHRRPD